jgi:hypothetical protein
MTVQQMLAALSSWTALQGPKAVSKNITMCMVVAGSYSSVIMGASSDSSLARVPALLLYRCCKDMLAAPATVPLCTQRQAASCCTTYTCCKLIATLH